VLPTKLLHPTRESVAGRLIDGLPNRATSGIKQILITWRTDPNKIGKSAVHFAKDFLAAAYHEMPT